MDLVAQLQAELEVKRAEAIQLFQLAETNQVDPATGTKLLDATKITPEEVQKREAELADLDRRFQIAKMAAFKADNEAKWKEMHQPEYKYTIHGGGNGNAGFVPSPNLKADGTPFTLTDLIVNSLEWKGRKAGGGTMRAEFEKYDMKSLFVSANIAPANQRDSQITGFAMRPLRVSDIIPDSTTTAQQIEYFEQTAAALDSATTVSESGTKPEAALGYTLRTKKIEKIAVWVPVTEEALDDEPQLRSLIEDDLRTSILREEEDQLLTGTGTSPQILGILNHAIQSQARGSDNNADAIFKSFTLVRWTGYAEPTAVVIHPNNWETIRLMKTTDNAYIWGPPSIPGVETLWGKPIVVTNAITANTALTGDFATYSRIWRRMGIRVDVSDSHSTFFVENKLAIRAEERMTVIVRRPAAFAKITGLN